MKLNYQQLFIDLQEKIIELYETDMEKAKIVREIIEEVKNKQKTPVFSDEY